MDSYEEASGMHHPKLRRPSGSTLPWLVAIAAIVLAMGGTGLAAKKYLISSTSQISPKVLDKLHGVKGERGVAGPAGAIGAAGANGAPGAPGPAGSAKGYAEVSAGGTLQTVDNVGFTAGATRSPSVGTYCIAAPPGADPNGVLIVGLAGGSTGFVAQTARTVCNANEYQVVTAAPNGVANSTISFNILAP
jgi:hypothetical protein